MRMKKMLAVFAALVGTVLSMPMASYAYSNGTEEHLEEEAEEKTFSIPGTGELLDDITDDPTKQFLTVQTENGNTFFLVIDHAGDSGNVYMLSLIDENDLAEFLEDKEEPEPEKLAVVLPEAEPEPEEMKEPEVKPVPGDSGRGMGAFAAIIVLVLGGGGGYYYFKVYKPKKEEENAQDENLEFTDGGAYTDGDSRDAGEEE